MRRKIIGASLLTVILLTLSTQTLSKELTIHRPVEGWKFSKIEEWVFNPIDETDWLRDDYVRPNPTPQIRPYIEPKPVVVNIPQEPVGKPTGRFIYDSNVSWYGPGFYGKRTACGHAYTKEIMGVAHRSLPCGTMVTFRNPANGRYFTVPVIDRGPYVDGRQWDLSGGLCVKLDHCYTGPIEYRIEG